VKLSDYVFQFLARFGVRHVFVLPGGGSMHLVDSLGSCAGLGYECCLHEQACTIAAEAYGRATNRLGVVLVTSGPGGTNTLTGVAGAWLASSPVLVISGQAKRPDLKGDSGARQIGSQEVDIVSVVGPLTKYAVTVMDPATIRYHLEKAVHLASTGRKGPVWLDLPLDVQAAAVEPEAMDGFVPPEPAPPAELPAQVAQALAMLAAAERPVLFAGNGVHSAGAGQPFLALAERLGIPVMTTWGACDLIPFEHPLCFGRPGPVASRASNFILQNADFLMTLGVRLDFDTTGYDQSQFARGARKVVVDIDPAEIGKLRMKVDLPIHCDCALVLAEAARQCGSRPGPDRNAWLARCRDWKTRYPILPAGAGETGEQINPFHFYTVLSEELAGNDLVLPCSSGAAVDMFWMVYRPKAGQRAFSTGGLGSMGFGLPAALGGCLAMGGRRTITMEGDGGSWMNIQEMATLARLGLPIKYFVMNNGGYGSVRTMQRHHFQGRLVACEPASGLPLPDILPVAKAFGLPAIRMTRPGEVRARIREVLDAEGPVVCDVVLDPEILLAPKVSSVVTASGGMVSRPLEDLWPFLDRDELRANMLIPLLPE
jgi:acetolactate synthase-1/2/3 large subunit